MFIVNKYNNILRILNLCFLFFIAWLPLTAGASNATNYSMAPVLSCSSGFVYNDDSGLCHKQASSVETSSPTYSCAAGYTYVSSRLRCEKTVATVQSHSPNKVCASGYTYSSSSDSCSKNVTLTAAPSQTCASGKILQNGSCYIRLSGTQCKTHSSAARSCQKTSTTYVILENLDYIDTYKWSGTSLTFNDDDPEKVYEKNGYIYWVGNYRSLAWSDSDDEETYNFNYHEACRCDIDQLIFSEPAINSCTSGYSYNSSAQQCQKNQIYTESPTLTCNSGYVLNGDQCRKTVSTVKTAARIINCNSGYSYNSASGYCEKVVYTDVTSSPHATCSIGGYSYSSTSKMCLKPMLSAVLPKTYSSTYFDSFPTSGEVVGTLAGAVNVSNSGAATYSIPISVPLGVGEFTPNISLNYNSDSGNGLLGKGWLLNSGIGSINRCAPQEKYDGETNPINFSGRDRLCLAGQRLILISGTYGSNGSTYSLESDDFSRIEAVGGTLGNPEYFIKTAKNGVKTYFGQTPTSKRLAKNGGYTLSWYTSRKQDVSSNEIHYDYYNDSSNFRVIRVSYAFAAGSPLSYVEFHYADRDDVSLQFGAGATPFRRDKRMVGISVHNDGQNVKQYHLAYVSSESQINNISRLESIQECAGGLCLPKTKFDWTNNEVGLGPKKVLSTGDYINDLKVLDLNVDGYEDLVFVAKNYSTQLQSFNIRWGSSSGYSDPEIIFSDDENRSLKKRIQVEDVNGDGIEDLVYDNYRVLSSYSNGVVSHSVSTGSTALYYQYGAKSAAYVDINGDGWIDRITNGVLREPTVEEVTPTNSQINAVSPDKYKKMSSIEVSLGVPFSSPDDQRFAEPYIVELSGDFEPSVFQFGEFNGDGKLDVILEEWRKPKFSGDETKPVHFGDNYFFDIPLSSGVAVLIHRMKLRNDIADAINPVDLNKDGYTDIVLDYCTVDGCVESEVSYWLMGSEDLPLKIVHEFGGVSEFYARAQLKDYDYDGYLDLFEGGNIKYLWRGDKFIPYEDGMDINIIGGGSHRFNARPAFVSYKNKRLFIGRRVMARNRFDGTAYPYDGQIEMYEYNNFEPISRIKKITNGLGAETSILYGDMGETDHYISAAYSGNRGEVVKGSLCIKDITGVCETVYSGEAKNSTDLKVRLGQGFYSSPSAEYLTKQGKVKDVYNGRTIVTQVSSRMPVVGTGTTMVSADVITEYYYARARVQANVGSLGFESMVVRDVSSGLETQYVYRQDFPFVGTTYFKQDRRFDSGLVLSNKYSDMSFKRREIPYIGYQSKVTEVAYSKNTNPIKEVVTSNIIDDWGNIVRQEAVTRGSEGEVRVMTSTNLYEGPFGERRGLISRNTVDVRVEENGRTEENLSVKEFTYTNNGLLKNTTVEPDKPEYRVVNTKRYDEFGNIVGEKVSANGLQERETITEYDDDGRYIIRTKNSLNHILNEIVNRNALGQVTQSKNANGYVNYYHYNALGQLQGESNNTGGWSKISLEKCDASCPPMGAYRITKTGVDGSWSRTIRDAWGRSIQSQSQSLDGSVIYVDVGYTAFGEKAYQSSPYFSGDSIEYFTYEYSDVFNRLTKVNRPGLEPSTTVYNGLTLEVDQGDGFGVQTKISNAFGQVVSIRDARGGIVNNSYDALGNLRFSKSIGSDNDPHNVIVELRYDHVGRKIYMDDPDKGVWRYRYNAYGELVTQTDARNNTQTFQYDVLGRTIRRTDRNAANQVLNHTRWYFDGASPNGVTYPNAIGLQSGVAHSQTTSYERCGQSTVEECVIPFYDNFGRQKKVWRSVGVGDAAIGYMTEVEYDNIGRVSKTYDALNGFVGLSGTYAVYNDFGFNAALYDLSSNDMLYQVNELDARGQVLNASHGNGVTSQFSYNSLTGRIEHQRATDSFTYMLQNIEYRWDGVGNLQYRKNTGGDNISSLGLSLHAVEETYCYDELGRLEGVRKGDTHCSNLGNNDQRVEYDSLGNIKFKYNVGHYSYGPLNGKYAGPHAVSATSDGVTYEYDASGNLIKDTYRTIKYTVFDKPYEITHNSTGVKTTFKYGANRNRWLRKDTKNESTSVTTTTMYLGNVERVTKTGSSEILWKRYIGDTVVNTITTSLKYDVIANHWQYIFKDMQGSVDVITDEIGSVIEDMSFDAWGERRTPHNGAALTESEKRSFNTLLESNGGTALDTRIATRGYTNHEMLDEVGLIHMNGRIYDPKLARFISADFIIQDPFNTQSYNRYSYVMNRPMVTTDPSGFEGELDKQEEPEDTKKLEEEKSAKNDKDLEVVVVTGQRPSNTSAGGVEIDIENALGLMESSAELDSRPALGGYCENDGLETYTYRGVTYSGTEQQIARLKRLIRRNRVAQGLKTFLNSGGVIGVSIGSKYVYVVAVGDYYVQFGGAQKGWTTKDFLKHYMTGGGKAVDLGKVGLGAEFENAPSVKGATAAFIDETMQGPIFNLSASDMTLTDVTNVGAKDFTGWPALFSVGNGVLNMDASCVSGSCTFTFETNDHFVDALDIYDRWQGNQDLPFSQAFEINHKWTVQRSYGQ